jgi:hypothetical protein
MNAQSKINGHKFLENDDQVIRWADGLEKAADLFIQSADRKAENVQIASNYTAAYLLMILIVNGVKQVSVDFLSPDSDFQPIDEMYQSYQKQVDGGKGWEYALTAWQLIYLCKAVKTAIENRKAAKAP